MTLYSKKIFLIDGLGGIASAIFLGIILTIFNPYIGMPQPVLIYLSLVALACAIYSISCYFFTGNNWKFFLKIICIANLLYCFLTIGLIIIYYPQLTVLGIVYFLAEIILIGILVVTEKKIIKNKSLP